MSGNEGIEFDAYDRSIHAIVNYLFLCFQHLDKKGSDSKNL
jgi:hypothetical protein